MAGPWRVGGDGNLRQLLGGKLSGATHILMAFKVVDAKDVPSTDRSSAVLEGKVDVGLRIGVEADARDVVQVYGVWSLER